jgi:hypothetical protein
MDLRYVTLREYILRIANHVTRMKLRTMIIMCPKVYSNSIHIKDFYSTIVGNIQKITKKKLVGTCGAKTSSLLSG